MEFNRDGQYYTISTPVALLSVMLATLMGQPNQLWRPMPVPSLRHWMRRRPLKQGVAL